VARFRRRSLFVVLTELAASVVEEALLPALPVLGRHHLTVIGAVRDPDVDAWARHPAADADASYRKAAAVAALDQRALAVARLQRAGATVIDALPGALAPRLADAYMRVKATGRL
jgi:uncharacterized protein (DUF58 family)